MSSERSYRVVVLALLAAACGQDLPVPFPTAVTPSMGFTGNLVPIEIFGTGFEPRLIQPASGGTPTLDATFVVLLDGDPLQDVRLSDAGTLLATVPRGIDGGQKSLHVTGPYGTGGGLLQAYFADDGSRAALEVSVELSPSEVSEGQPFLINVYVKNSGKGDAENVVSAAPTFSGTGQAEAPVAQSSPSLRGLAAGSVALFTWSSRATRAGTLQVHASASAMDPFSTTPIGTTGGPVALTVTTPTTLSARLPVSGAAAVGQEFVVAMTVTNTGGAPARQVTAVAPQVSDGGLVTLKAGTAASPVSVDTLDPGASATFSWIFVAGTTPGTVRFTGGATAYDGNSGEAVYSDLATSGDFTVGSAGLSPDFTATPETASAGRPLTLTLKLTNPGLAAVQGLIVGAPVIASTDGATADRVSGPTPAPPATLAAGQSVTLSWVYTPRLTTGVTLAHLSIDLPVSGTDEFSHGPVAARPQASVTVQAPPQLAATLSTRSTATVGQTFSATLAVTNGGVAAATAVVPSAIAGCGAPTPASVASLGPDTPATFTYAGCSFSTAGTVTLSASASGLDANAQSTAVSSNVAGATVVVQNRPVVQGTLSVPATIARGAQFTLTLTLRNTGGATAQVTPQAPVPTGPVTLVSGPSAGSVLVPGGGGTAVVTWTYSADAVGSVSFTGSATGTDTNTGQPLSSVPVTASNTGAIQQAALGSSLAASRGTTLIGQAVTFTLTLTNTGTAAVTGVTPSLSLNGAPGTLSAPSPASIARLAPGASSPVTWTFTPSAATAVTASASAVGNDELSLAQVSTNQTVTNILQVQGTLGGTVSGLAGSGLVLASPGEPNLTITANGSFTFATPLSSGTAYAVTVATQPTNPWQTCVVASGTGFITTANVTNVTVTCTTNSYTIGGTVTGLSLASTGVVLRLNGGNALTIDASGAFSFPTPVSSGGSYAVTVGTQPTSPWQTCVVGNGSGTVAGANVTNVTVTCTTNSYTIGGTVSGLAGTGLVLRNNGNNATTITGNGAFTFSTALLSGATYAVTVSTQPTNLSQTCVVGSGSGTVAGANVTTVTVTCTTNTYTVGGTVSGLAGSGLVLRNNGGNDLAITGNGAFTFSTPVASGGAYAVTVGTQPAGPTQTCTVASGSGTVTSANVTSVTVTCATNSYTIGGTVSGLAGTGLVLRNNGGNNLTIVANGAFTFSTALLSGASYSVTVLTQPTNLSQTCTVSNGSGTVGGANVTTVAVSCTTNTYTLGGTVSGLSGAGLVLATAGEANLSVPAGATTFTFATPLASGTAYAVSVVGNPTGPSQTCTVTAGASGTITSANVTSVAVTCTTNSYTLGGTVNNLLGTGLQLATAGEATLSVPAGATTFTFATPLASGTAYNVSVAASPSVTVSQSCLVSTGGSGTIGGANVTSVVVDCFTNSFTVGGAVSNLTGAGLVLQDNLGDNLALTPGETSFTFATPVASGSAYSVTVLTQPAGQTCSVAAGSGTVGVSSVTTVSVSCTP